MKVVFLDIDGVLNTRPGSLDGDKLDLVHEIRKATCCDIVLSSSWRKDSRQMGRIRAELHIDAMTPILDRQEGGLWTAPPRWQEIDAWLHRNPQVTRLAIVDDDKDAGTGFGEAFFQIDPNTGLTPTIAKEIIDRLNA